MCSGPYAATTSPRGGGGGRRRDALAGELALAPIAGRPPGRKAASAITTRNASTRRTATARRLECRATEADRRGGRREAVRGSIAATVAEVAPAFNRLCDSWDTGLGR